MSVTNPSIATLTATVVGQLEASIGQSIPLLPKSFSRVLAKSLAGLHVVLYRYAGFQFLQLFIQYATNDETTINGRKIRPLTEWGRLCGIGDPGAATKAVLNVTITVTQQTGTMAAGAHLLREETGVIYQTQAPVTLDAATKPVVVRAVNDEDGNGGEGTIGNLEAGDELRFMSPMTNVATAATVSSVVTSAADAEDIEVYRARVLDRFRNPPQGGSYADYRGWGQSVEGILHVYPYASIMPGEVDVYVEATVASSGSDDGIPTDAQLDAVDAAIQYVGTTGKASRRPVTAGVNVNAIVRTEFDVTVTGLSVDDETTTEAQIDAGVDEWLRTREPYLVGLSVPPRKDVISQAELSGVVSAIVAAAGGTFASLTLYHGATAIISHRLTDGEKAKLGNSGACTYA